MAFPKRLFVLLLCGTCWASLFGQSITLSFDSDNAICSNANGFAWVMPSGGTAPYSILWSNGVADDTIDQLLPGTYSVSVADASGAFAVDSIVIGDDTFDIQLIFIPSAATCGLNDGVVSVAAMSGTPPYAYQWVNGSTGIQLSSLSSGIYPVTVTDANGCSASAPGIVRDAGAPSLNFTIDGTSCFGTVDGQIDVTATGGAGPLTFAWSNGLTGNLISNLGGGTYHVTVTDNNGCKNYGTPIVPQPRELVAEVYAVRAACGGFGGKAGVKGLGGTPPYSFQWPNGDTVPVIGGLISGLYMASVIDANGCVDWGITSISTIDPPASVVAAVANSCSGKTDGVADLSVEDGKAPFTFQWSNGSTAEDLNGVSEGIYTVTVTDANQCSNTNTVRIDPIIELLLGFSISPASDGAASDGTAEALISGGAQPYTFLWSTGLSSAKITGLSPGTYAVTVSDVNGCFKADSTGLWVTGIGGPDDQAQITLYPNPANGSIRVAFGQAQHKALRVSVIDGMGRMLIDRPLSTNPERLDLRDLAAGVYRMRIADSEGGSITRSFVVQP